MAASGGRSLPGRVGIAALLCPRSLCYRILALLGAHSFEIGFPVGTARLPDLVEICSSPLLIGLSDLLPIGGAPLAHELSTFLGVLEGH
jgi:hypothetical protein